MRVYFSIAGLILTLFCSKMRSMVSCVSGVPCRALPSAVYCAGLSCRLGAVSCMADFTQPLARAY